MTIRNSDGSVWDWRRAALRGAALAAVSIYAFHSRFGFSWLTSVAIIAALFATAGLLWYWAYARQRRPASDAFGRRQSGAVTGDPSPRRRGVTTTTVRRTEQLTLTCPSDRADVVRAAVEQWLRTRGVTATVTADEHEPGKSRIHARLSSDETSKVDLSAPSVQAELQDVLTKALVPR